MPNATLTLGTDCYATWAKIHAIIPYISLNTSTRPTKQEAADMARDSYHMLNSMISQLGYVTPVPSTNASAIAIVGRLHALDSAVMIDTSVRAGIGKSSQLSDGLQKQRDFVWKMFEKGDMLLPSVAREGNYKLRNDDTTTSSQFYVDDDGNVADPVFSRDMDF